MLSGTQIVAVAEDPVGRVKLAYCHPLESVTTKAFPFHQSP